VGVHVLLRLKLRVQIELALIGFSILNREDREDRKENLFGSFSCRAISSCDE